MSKYKRQVILSVDPDDVISDGDTQQIDRSLTKGCETRRVELRDVKDRQALLQARADFEWAWTERPWRLYLSGHGDFASQKLGHLGSKEIAKFLKRANLKDHPPYTVSVTGCGLGADSGAGARQHRIGHSINSFAGNLHRQLKDIGLEKTDLHARTWNVSRNRLTKSPSAKFTKANPTVAPSGVDQSLSQTGETWIQKQSKSKLLFTWEGNIQRRYWAYAGGEKKVDIEYTDITPL